VIVNVVVAGEQLDAFDTVIVNVIVALLATSSGLNVYVGV
jgi:hypothetical protein